MSQNIHTPWTPLRQYIYWTKMLLVSGSILFFYVCQRIYPVPYNYFPQILELRIMDRRTEELGMPFFQDIEVLLVNLI